MKALYLVCLLTVLCTGYVNPVKAGCMLSGSQVNLTNRLFAYHEDTHYYPLRTDKLQTGQKLDMICNNEDIKQTQCLSNGNFKPALPMPDCSSPLKPSVEAVDDDSCPYTMYRVGHRLNDAEFLEVYRSCFDKNSASALFTIHMAYPYKLSIKRPMQGFTTDKILTGAVASSYEAKKVYARFRELLGEDQSYVTSPRDMIFDRGHLAPSADYMLETSMRQTFKYINVVAQFCTINRSNWKSIETWVRGQLASGNFDALQICTGGIGVLQLKDTSGHLQSIYLAQNNRNPVPQWLFKIVSDGAVHRYAFVTNNNVYQEMSPPCKPIKCPASIQLTQTKEAGLTFCCNPDEFLKKNVPTLVDIC